LSDRDNENLTEFYSEKFEFAIFEQCFCPASACDIDQGAVTQRTPCLHHVSPSSDPTGALRRALSICNRSNAALKPGFGMSPMGTGPLAPGARASSAQARRGAVSICLSCLSGAPGALFCALGAQFRALSALFRDCNGAPGAPFAVDLIGARGAPFPGSPASWASRVTSSEYSVVLRRPPPRHTHLRTPSWTRLSRTYRTSRSLISVSRAIAFAPMVIWEPSSRAANAVRTRTALRCFASMRFGRVAVGGAGPIVAWYARSVRCTLMLAPRVRPQPATRRCAGAHDVRF
jgi:hypothetical protein